MTAAEHSEPAVDACASTEPGPFDDDGLDIRLPPMSVSYGQSPPNALPRPLRGSATIDWLADRNPLRIIIWEDPVVEAAGHHVLSPYVETFWLPSLGPSATWMLRRLVGWLEGSDEPISVDLPELGAELGLGGRVGRSSPIVRTLARLGQFQVAAPAGDAFAIRRHLAPLPQRLAHQLPPRLRDATTTAGSRSTKWSPSM